MEVIILAGGKGTRLQSVVSDVPKPMADISGKPFLEYLLTYIATFEVSRFVLSIGYKKDTIREYFRESFQGIPISYAIEDEPLGTGGAIIESLKYIKSKSFLLLNGDSFLQVSLRDLQRQFQENSSDIEMVLKPMEDFERYGSVILDGESVIGFQEKKYQKSGLINGGIYLMKTSLFHQDFPRKFSFESDFLEKNISDLKINAYLCNGYFVDIGVPSDYLQAQIDLPKVVGV
ncbi:MAG: nucleotidyltransferase family protein [Spirochaetota bacterium]